MCECSSSLTRCDLGSNRFMGKDDGGSVLLMSCGVFVWFWFWLQHADPGWRVASGSCIVVVVD